MTLQYPLIPVLSSLNILPNFLHLACVFKIADSWRFCLWFTESSSRLHRTVKEYADTFIFLQASHIIFIQLVVTGQVTFDFCSSRVFNLSSWHVI